MFLSVIPSAARILRSGWFCGARNLSGHRFRCPARILSALLCALCVSALSSSAFAQSCALCYESARNSGNPSAINHGILVLLLPTLFLFVAVLVFTIRRANSHQ